MQQWFRALNYKIKYISNLYTIYPSISMLFRRISWILDDQTLKEPFDSDRYSIGHSIDTANWKELHNKIRWMSNSGRKRIVWKI